MANIEQLKGLISSKDGVARGNVFRVILPPIPGSNVSGEEKNLLCTGVNLPGRQIVTQEKRIGLMKQKVATDYLFDDVSLTFLLLNDYGIRGYFEAWQNACVDQNQQELSYLSDYAFDVKIQQLKKGFSVPVYQTSLNLPKLPPLIQNKLPKIGPFDFAQGELDLDFVTSDKVVYECTLLQAFPTTMNAIELSNAQEDIIQLNVQLSYRNWVGGLQGSGAAFTSSIGGSIAREMGSNALRLFT